MGRYSTPTLNRNIKRTLLAADPHCGKCGAPLTPNEPTQLVDKVKVLCLKCANGSRLSVARGDRCPNGRQRALADAVLARVRIADWNLPVSHVQQALGIKSRMDAVRLYQTVTNSKWFLIEREAAFTEWQANGSPKPTPLARVERVPPKRLEPEAVPPVPTVESDLGAVIADDSELFLLRPMVRGKPVAPAVKPVHTATPAEIADRLAMRRRHRQRCGV